jgi:hypothetical protein
MATMQLKQTACKVNIRVFYVHTHDGNGERRTANGESFKRRANGRRLGWMNTNNKPSNTKESTPYDLP